ncbi:MAG: hypothetical protein K2J07_00920 [Muribaculaceae bacterium]|nr:hypothetical protein [Muribaculaceae bacterium]MDE6831282.1 hypothetical protein [Muribaculaceae bacterium]
MTSISTALKTNLPTMKLSGNDITGQTAGASIDFMSAAGHPYILTAYFMEGWQSEDYTLT